MTEWILFNEAAARLAAKYGSRREAARSLRIRATTGSIRSMARAALITKFGGAFGTEPQLAETRSDYLIEPAFWNATAEPSLTETWWTLSSFSADLDRFSSNRRSITLSEVCVERSVVENLLATLPDVPLTFEGRLEAQDWAPAAFSQPVPIHPSVKTALTNAFQRNGNTGPLKSKGGAPRETEKWDAVTVAIAKLANEGKLDPSMGQRFRTQTEFRAAILDDEEVTRLGVKDETLKPLARKVWQAMGM